MAARMRKTHQDDVRAKIQTSQLINRLTEHALTGPCLDASQVRAIEILIKKTLPDLSAVDHSADDDMMQAIGTVIFKGLNGDG